MPIARIFIGRRLELDNSGAPQSRKCSPAEFARNSADGKSWPAVPLTSWTAALGEEASIPAQRDAWRTELCFAVPLPCFPRSDRPAARSEDPPKVFISNSISKFQRFLLDTPSLSDENKHPASRGSECAHCKFPRR